MKTRLILLVLFLFSSALFTSCATTKLNLTGTLEGGIFAPGGETTGYRLNDVSVEVDVSKISNRAELEGKSVKVPGLPIFST